MYIIYRKEKKSKWKSNTMTWRAPLFDNDGREGWVKQVYSS